MPAVAGIGLRAPHIAQILRERPALGWVEVHSENYFADGGGLIDTLMAVRALYPLSLHGVGLSLGSADPLDPTHLAKLKRTVDRFEPELVSEHLCWSSIDGRFANDLLPLPYTAEALRHVAQRIAAVQDCLGRQILIENVSSYLEFAGSEMPEWEFLSAVAAESGCAVLLDVNNIYVSAMNHGFAPGHYLRSIPAGVVREMHLAGHTATTVGAAPILIDTHSAPVAPPVWDLYRDALQRFGAVPTLIEWDAEIPSLEVLLAEAAHADRLLGSLHADAA